MKRGIIFHFHTIVIALVLAVLCSSRFGKVFTAAGAPGAGMPDFNEMFKNFDFEKFVAELDDQLAGIEEEEALAGTKKPVAPVGSYGPAPTKQASNAKPADAALDSKQEDVGDVPDDPEELIIKPPMVKLAKGSGESTRSRVVDQLPHKDAEKALTSYVQDIIHSLHKIDQAAISSHGEEFHEQYLNACGDDVTDLEVSLSMLVSKRAYRVGVLAPPKELEEKLRTYRKNIITVRNKLMQLAKELAVTEKQELSEEERMRKKLEELVQVGDLQTTPREPLVKTKQRVVNDNDDNDSDEEALDTEDDYEQAALPALTERPSSLRPTVATADKSTGSGGAGKYTPPPIEKTYPSVLDNNDILDEYQNTFGNNAEEIA